MDPNTIKNNNEPNTETNNDNTPYNNSNNNQNSNVNINTQSNDINSNNTIINNNVEQKNNTEIEAKVEIEAEADLQLIKLLKLLNYTQLYTDMVDVINFKIDNIITQNKSTNLNNPNNSTNLNNSIDNKKYIKNNKNNSMDVELRNFIGKIFKELIIKKRAVYRALVEEQRRCNSLNLNELKNIKELEPEFESDPVNKNNNKNKIAELNENTEKLIDNKNLTDPTLDNKNISEITKNSNIKKYKDIINYDSDFYNSSIKFYIQKIIKEIKDVTHNIVLKFLDNKIFAYPEIFLVDLEDKVYFLKMKADFLRYVAEISFDSEKNEISKLITKLYSEARVAANTLKYSNPVKMGLLLNISIYEYEVLNNYDEGLELAKKTFNEGMNILDSLKTEHYKDVTLIIQLLKDNINIWNKRDEEMGDMRDINEKEQISINKDDIKKYEDKNNTTDYENK